MAAALVVVVVSMIQSSSSLAFPAPLLLSSMSCRRRHRRGGGAFAPHTDDRIRAVQLEQHRPRLMAMTTNRMIKRSLLTMGGANGDDDDTFDPFLQSPLSFGETTATTTKEEVDVAATEKKNFGFLTYAENYAGTAAKTTTSVATLSTQQEQQFAAQKSSSSSSSSSSDFEFDPLLSPHVYTNGVNAVSSIHQPQQQQQQQNQKRLGIVLIDHGSKRQASNDHIHKIAQLYEQSLQPSSPSSSSSSSNMKQQYSSVIVKAAHMEIASPSILDTIRDIIINDKVTSIICVPYFLSPGRHATEDVPELIRQAREVLRQENLLTLAPPPGSETADDDEISILMSDALGTHLVGMLSVVDDLVVQTLNNVK